jgi:ABC-type sugar transport system ATPase subunit
MYAVEFIQLSKKFKEVVIADHMNLRIRDESFTVLFGAPGSGKSTLLRLITGLDKADSGDILLRGAKVNAVSPNERNIGYVPQSFALYPHYSVYDNIAYPLTLMRMRKDDIKPIVEQVAAKLQISHLLKKKPEQCSGGEKQRVAIARGIVKNTKIFILDDPLTGLDFKLRERLFDDLRQMREDLDATFIYTTSDPLEALILAEDIHVIDSGKVVESGTIEQVYQHTQHARTMELLGFPNTNVFGGTLSATTGKHAQVGSAVVSFPILVEDEKKFDAAVQIAVRPQHIQINPRSNGNLLTMPAEITLVEDLGGELHVYLETGDTPLEALIPNADIRSLTEGAATIGIQPQHIKVYSQQYKHYIGQGVANGN